MKCETNWAMALLRRQNYRNERFFLHLEKNLLIEKIENEIYSVKSTCDPTGCLAQAGHYLARTVILLFSRRGSR